MAIRRDNKNLSETPITKELRALLDASGAYDLDNVYLSEEGWVYRHYKRADKSKWWDEILFSGEVDVNDASNNPVSATVSAGTNLGTDEYTPTLEIGDGKVDFDYGTTEDSSDDGGDPSPPPPPPPATEIDEVTISGDAAPTEGDTKTYTATVTSTTSDITYAWTVSAGGSIDSGDGSSSIVVTWNTSGAQTVDCQVGSTDDNWNGVTQEDTFDVNVAVLIPETSIGGVTINTAPTSMTVGVAETFAAAIGGDATVTWKWKKASGPGTPTFSAETSATTTISVDAAGDYVFTAEASSTDANLTDATPQSLDTGSITATNPPTIGGVNLEIVPAAMTVGVNETFAASIGGDATVTWEWRKASGPGNAAITFPEASTTQISVDTAGDYVFTAEASSDDANLTGGSPNSQNTGTITATDPPPAGVTLNLTGAAVGNSAYETNLGDNGTVTVAAGQTLTINNNSGGHPVDIVVSDGGAQVAEGTLTGAPAGDGDTVTWDTTGVTPGDYYYQCTSHPAMIGTITVTA